MSNETNKERFLRLVDPTPTDTMDQIRHRIENRYWIKEVQNIAFRILDRMDELDWDKSRLATETQLDQTIIDEILSGKRNLLISELMRISNVLDLKITFEIQ